MLAALGPLIRERRMQLGLSVRQMCLHTPITSRELAELEWQQAVDIDCITFIKLAYGLGLEVSELLAIIDFDSPIDPTGVAGTDTRKRH